MDELVELYDKIELAWSDFSVEKEKILKGNKAAAGRARKVTLALGILLKEYRKLSVQALKEQK